MNLKKLLFLTLTLSFNVISFSKEDLSFLNEKSQEIKKYTFKELRQSFKVEKVNVFNYVSKEVEVYNAFDLSKILSKVYGQNKWKSSYAIGTITTDGYAPLIRNKIFTVLKPYLAFERADGKKFVNKKSFSKGHYSLAPYYIIWKNPKKIGNLKKVRAHWPWQVEKIFIYPNEPNELATSGKFQKGKETFLNHCISCHSIKGVGGTKGGELTDLLKASTLIDQQLPAFILRPRDVKKNSKMPHFPIYLDNKENRIKQVIEYIKDRVK